MALGKVITALLLPALFLEGVVLALQLDEGILKQDTDHNDRAFARKKPPPAPPTWIL